MPELYTEALNNLIIILIIYPKYEPESFISSHQYIIMQTIQQISWTNIVLFIRCLKYSLQDHLISPSCYFASSSVVAAARKLTGIKMISLSWSFRYSKNSALFDVKIVKLLFLSLSP